MDIKYYGHACFCVTVNEKKLLFDPFISGNPLAKHVDIDKIEADYILISHGHEDHVADVWRIARNTGATIIASYEVATWFGKLALKNHSMNTGGKWKFDFGTVKCVSAIHSSSMPDGSYGGNPMGFIILSDEKNFYYSGDTALTLDMQLIPLFAKVDFCVLPIGDNFTMGMEEAAEAAKMAGCDTVIGVHYDTFDHIKIDHRKAVDYFNSRNIDLMLPEIGNTITIN